ncbi:hypothetical protein PHISP_08671 [Aspergillus sp. HF37]|nr:hypothetical protein PHISP_08671 [Aspergillus sp. HF37]
MILHQVVDRSDRSHALLKCRDLALGHRVAADALVECVALALNQRQREHRGHSCGRDHATSLGGGFPLASSSSLASWVIRDCSLRLAV